MRFLLPVLLILLLVPTYSGDSPVARLGESARMAASPVLLDPAEPARRSVGRLTFLGGIRLTSHDPAFGGFSSMSLAGSRFTLLSDGGTIVSFDLDSDWHIHAPRFANLPAGPGTGWQKESRDSESMTVDPDTGEIWAGFETFNQIWRYAPGFVRAEARSRPAAMRKWPNNGGAESLVRLRNGAFVVLCETCRWHRHKAHRAVWFDRDPTIDAWHGFRFFYRSPVGYDPSDAVELPNGDLLVLNRRFELPYDFTAKLTIVRRKDIAPGRVAIGREIASFAAPLIHDNFEALAVSEDAGQTIVWMASDDNQSILQRSLLLKFRLMSAEPDTPKTTAPPRMPGTAPRPNR